MILHGQGKCVYVCVCSSDCKTVTQCKYTVVLSRTCGFSETDDSSSIPPPEPGPLSRKPSGLHLTLPDFQETETGLCYLCGVRVLVGGAVSTDLYVYVLAVHEII